MPSSPLASLMRQIESDLRAPLQSIAPQPVAPSFDAEQYFATGGPVHMYEGGDPPPRPLTIRRGEVPKAAEAQDGALRDEDTYGPANIEERRARIQEMTAPTDYPGDNLEAPQGYITPATAVEWRMSDAGPYAVDAQGKTLPLIKQPGMLPMYYDPSVDSIRPAMPGVPDFIGNVVGAPAGITAARVARAGMMGERPAANVVSAMGAGEPIAKIAPGRKMTLADVRREFDPHAGANMTPEQIDLLVDAYGRVASPASDHPDIAARGREIAESYRTKGGSESGGRSYFAQKPSTPLEDLGRTAEPIPYTHEPKAIVEKSWQDVGRERAGSPLISLGGDLSDLVRLRAYGPKGEQRALARPTDIHAGFDYMLEPNLNSVWSNNPEHAAMLEKQILKQKEIQRAVDKDLPVMAVANPMGPGAIDSAKNMMDLYLSAVEGAGIHPEYLKAAAADIRSGKFGKSPAEKANLQKKLADFPGFEDMDKAREFLLNNPDVAGKARSSIIKGMEKADWVKKGFPEVGQLRVAASSPKFMMAPGNMMGGRMVELDPRMFHEAEANRYFDHFTYGGDSPGKYYADVPLVQRQYGAPDVTDQLLAKYNVERPNPKNPENPKAPISVHPYSTDQSGRDTWRKMFEEQRMMQPINERMMESIALGEARRKSYGYARGGAASSDELGSLYKNLLGREGDESGIKYWSDQLAGGMSLDDISNAFRSSSEYKAHEQANPIVQASLDNMQIPASTGAAAPTTIDPNNPPTPPEKPIYLRAFDYGQYEDPLEARYKYLSQALNPTIAAAAMGNFQTESWNNPNQLQTKTGAPTGDPSFDKNNMPTGFGSAMWGRERLTNPANDPNKMGLFDFAEAYGYDPNSVEGQDRFSVYELTQNPEYRSLYADLQKAGPDVNKATALFGDVYENPANLSASLTDRQKQANLFASRYGTSNVPTADQMAQVQAQQQATDRSVNNTGGWNTGATVAQNVPLSTPDDVGFNPVVDTSVNDRIMEDANNWQNQQLQNSLNYNFADPNAVFNNYMPLSSMSFSSSGVPGGFGGMDNSGFTLFSSPELPSWYTPSYESPYAEGGSVGFKPMFEGDSPEMQARAKQLARLAYSNPRGMSPADRRDWNSLAGRYNLPPSSGSQNTYEEQTEESMSALQNGPSASQKAGNYASGGRAVVGHTQAAGVPVSLENHKGETRHRASSGDSRMAADYGYIDNSRPDADHMKVDAYVGPHKDSKRVFVINQQHPHTGKFNEHKVLLGYKDRAHALRDYTHSFSDGLGHKRIQSVVEMDSHHLKDWIKKNHNQPVHKGD